jgi:hypothetical protein
MFLTLEGASPLLLFRLLRRVAEAVDVAVVDVAGDGDDAADVVVVVVSDDEASGGCGACLLTPLLLLERSIDLARTALALANELMELLLPLLLLLLRSLLLLFAALQLGAALLLCCKDWRISARAASLLFVLL